MNGIIPIRPHVEDTEQPDTPAIGRWYWVSDVSDTILAQLPGHDRYVPRYRVQCRCGREYVV
jgi:hypothetical protein